MDFPKESGAEVTGNPVQRSVRHAPLIPWRCSDDQRTRGTWITIAGEDAPSGADGGLLLDRLLPSEQFIPPSEAGQALRDCGCLDSRRCTLSFRVTLWLNVLPG
jgi:hypothetical protein